MRKWPLLGFALSSCVGLMGWSIDKLVDGLDWLPVVALPLSVSGIAGCGFWWLISYFAERTRKPLPGFGAYMAVVVHQGMRGARRYIFEMGSQGQQGAALYTSASDRLIFVVRDTTGEPYAIELPIGRRGLPLGEPVYLGAEAGRDGQTTVMRVLLDGKVAGERRLPFPIDFGRSDISNFTLGANNEGGEHGEFTLNNIAIVHSTLGDSDARGMAHFQMNRASAPGGSVLFGSEGRATWLTTRPGGE